MEENRNFSVVSVGKAIDMLSNAYCKVINKGLSPKTLPSVMMWGAPGVGKSQAVRQIGKVIEKNTSKKVVVTDVRLLLFNPIDLRGIPTSNADKTLAIWLKPQIFQMDDNENIVNILFLDEISAAPQSVQAAAYQITLDRVVGEHKLPDNCIVIAAGNRVTDKSVAFKMPKALANRLLHIEIEGNIESWCDWAVKAGIHEKVVGFLSAKAECLFGFDPKNDDLAFATPRSWEMVSNIMQNVSDDIQEIYSLVAGLVGSGSAIQFSAWCKMWNKLPKMEDVFDGLVYDVPKEIDMIYAIVSSMTAYARTCKDDYDRINNSLEYAKKLPYDFIRLLISNYELIEDNYIHKLRKMPKYIELATEKGGWRNGTV